MGLKATAAWLFALSATVCVSAIALDAHTAEEPGVNPAKAGAQSLGTVIAEAYALPLQDEGTCEGAIDTCISDIFRPPCLEDSSVADCCQNLADTVACLEPVLEGCSTTPEFASFVDGLKAVLTEDCEDGGDGGGGADSGDTGDDGNDEDIEDSDEDSDEDSGDDSGGDPASDDDDSQGDDAVAACFPADSTVALQGGGISTMRELRAGDRVLAAGCSYSEIFGFTHRTDSVWTTFVRIRTADTVVTLSPGHYLVIGERLVAAGAVSRGHEVQLGDGRPSTVLEVSRVTLEGLYNPHTMAGTIVVDGVLASTFTRAVHPRLAQLLLLLPKLAHRMGLKESVPAALYGDVPVAVRRLLARGTDVVRVF